LQRRGHLSVVETLQSVDLALFHALRPYHAPWLDQLFSWISASGGAGAVWLVLGIIAFAQPSTRAAAWRVFLTIALAYVTVDAVIKPLVARPRPSIVATAPARELPPLPRTFSFPSGHAASTFGAAVAVSRMWPRAAPVWWLLACLIGYSRIYLGHHYPLDVAGGAVMGILLAMWVLGGRHPATDARTLPTPLPAGTIVRP
jgi:undecaprenyl-diphosphatase